MALVLPHAPPPAPPGKAAAANLLKVPAAQVPPKAAAAAVSFRTILEKAHQSFTKALKDPAAPPAPTHGADLTPKKTVKAEPAAEKAPVKAAPAPKKAAEARSEAGEAQAAQAAAQAVLAAHLQPRPEAVKAAGGETKALETVTDKAKGPRTDRKAEAAVPAPVTAASAEVARAQAAQNGPRQADRTEDKQKVFVVDRRSDKEKERSRAETAATTPVNAAVEVQTQTAKAPEAKTPSAEVQVSFQTVAGKGNSGFDVKAQASSPSPRDALTFQQYLVDRGYGQLVDQARIVLKDQNAGEIRMTLYPESLGKVKVSLNLADDSLAGQIFVENQTVKDVFQSNMDGLLQAFQDGGWSDVSLQVSVGQDGGTGAQNRQPAPAPQARDYGRQVAQAVAAEGPVDRLGSWNDRRINLTA